MNYDQMTIPKMEEIHIRLEEELEQRREDWKKLADQIQLFTERHGLIAMQDKEGRLFYINSDTDFSELGLIYISRF